MLNFNVTLKLIRVKQLGFKLYFKKCIIIAKKNKSTVKLYLVSERFNYSYTLIVSYTLIWLYKFI